MLQIGGDLNGTTPVTTSGRYTLRTFNTQRSYAAYFPKSKGILQAGEALG